MKFLDQLVKHWRLRLSALSAGIAFILFIDELLKEGYGFDFWDLFNPMITHEKLIAIFVVLALVFGWRFHRNKA